ncbi:hypothetical protein Ancab_006660, partial [Ancistrocladus abbreviatus]
MVRRSPKSLHFPDGEQHKASVFSSSKFDLLWLEGSFTGFLRDHISLTLLREGLRKEGLTDCVVRPIGQRTVLLTATNNGSLHQLVKDNETVLAQWRWGFLTSIDEATSQRQRFDIARFAVQTHQPGCILTTVKIVIDGDEFLIKVTEDPAPVVERRGVGTYGSGGVHNDSLPQFSSSHVSDSFAGDHFPYMVFPQSKIVKSAPCQLLPQGLIAVIGGARANDESGSVHMGSSALPQDVTGRLKESGGFSGKHKGHNPGQAPIRSPCSGDDPLSDTIGPTERSSLGSPIIAHSQSHGIVAPSNGAGEMVADLASPSSITKPSAGPPHVKRLSRPTKHAQKKSLEDILQLRHSKRVIRKGKKSRKVEHTISIGDDTGVNFGTSASGDSLHDSHIMNRNQVLMSGNEHLGNGSPGLSPSAICAVLSQLGVVKESNVDETVQWIADMEMRDAQLFSGTDKSQISSLSLLIADLDSKEVSGSLLDAELLQRK